MSHDLITMLASFGGITLGAILVLVALSFRKEQPAVKQDAELPKPATVVRKTRARSDYEVPSREPYPAEAGNDWEPKEVPRGNFACERCKEVFPEWFGEDLSAGIFGGTSLRVGGLFGAASGGIDSGETWCKPCLREISADVPPPQPSETEEAWQERLEGLVGKGVLPKHIEDDYAYRKSQPDFGGIGGTWQPMPWRSGSPAEALDRELTIAEAAAGMGAIPFHNIPSIEDLSEPTVTDALIKDAVVALLDRIRQCIKSEVKPEEEASAILAALSMAPPVMRDMVREAVSGTEGTFEFGDGVEFSEEEREFLREVKKIMAEKLGHAA